jgi:hypothetical protein
MIKKKIKKHYLVYNLERKWEDSGLLDGLTGLGRLPIHEITILRTGDNALEVTGDVRVNNGLLHSIGTVIWNQELQRLEFWDGNMWVPINTTIIH